jgi:phage shock protein E
MTRLILIGLFLGAIALFGAGCAVLFAGRSETAHRWMKEGAVMVDVRGPDEFAKGHLDGARNIPVGELASRVGELGAKDTKVIVYCHSGIRATRAASILRDQGFTQVTNLGPMSAW